MSRVLMLVLNPMTSDARVDREASALGHAGHEVAVAATHAPALPQEETRDGYRLLRLPYRRVLKDLVVGRSRTARARAEEQRLALEAVRLHGGRRHVVLSRLLGLRAAAIWCQALLIRLVGGAVLKTLRSRILPLEYWAGTAKHLPGWMPRCDVVHAHDLGTLRAAALLARHWQRAAPSQPRPAVVYDSHELYVDQLTSWRPRERALWRLHEQRWIRRADLVITVSEGIADTLQRRYRLERRPLVVYNSPDAPPLPERDNRLREDLRLRPDDRIVVYAGAVKAGRGVDAVVRALRHGDWHLALVGANPSSYLDELVAAARTWGVDKRLHILPAVPPVTLPAYLSGADIAVHPLEPSCLNHDLAMPNKLFDYVFAGLPVVVSDLREMGTFVRRHQVGVVLRSRQSFDIAACISTALQERQALAPTPALLDDLGEIYGWATQRDRLRSAYDRLPGAE